MFDSLEEVGPNRHVVIKQTNSQRLFEAELLNRQRYYLKSDHVMPLVRTHMPCEDQFVLVLPHCATSVSTVVAEEGYFDLY